MLARPVEKFLHVEASSGILLLVTAVIVYMQILSACALALAHGANIRRSNVPDVHLQVDVHDAHTILTRI